MQCNRNRHGEREEDEIARAALIDNIANIEIYRYQHIRSATHATLRQSGRWQPLLHYAMLVPIVSVANVS